MNDIMKIIKSFEESCFLIKGVDKSIKDEAEEQKKEDFLECYQVLPVPVYQEIY